MYSGPRNHGLVCHSETKTRAHEDRSMCQLNAAARVRSAWNRMWRVPYSHEIVFVLLQRGQ